MKPLRAAIIIVGLCFASQAQGPNPIDGKWQYATASTDGDRYYQILKTTYADIREVWIKREGQDKDISIELERYNCTSGARQLLHLTVYRNNGIVSDAPYDKSEWQYAERDTIGEALLTSVCGQRKREWVYIGSSEKDSTAHFIQRASLTRRGNIVRAWIRYAKNEETKETTLSEFNCSERKMRELQSTRYSGSSTWKYVVPDSVGEDLLKFACRGSSGRPSARRLAEP